MRSLPERQCGPCTACCKFMPIADAELTKPTNVLCPHCAEGIGCKVYDVRPTPCADWVCGWRVMRQIPLGWRPNESGLVFRVEDVLDDEITVTVVNPDPNLATPELAELMIAWQQAGIAVHLETVGPPGFYPARKPVNAMIEEASGDPVLLDQLLLAEWESMAHNHAWVADGFAFRSTITLS